VVRNLLSNALKFTSRNGTIRVTLSVQEDLTTTGSAAEEMEPSSSSNKWVRFFNRFLLRSPKTYSEAFPFDAKTLIIEVVDSGVGISLVIIIVNIIIIIIILVWCSLKKPLSLLYRRSS
jgi:signal transduction histidine kinase